MKDNTIFIIDFHGHDLRAFFLGGAIHFMARDVGKALGYSGDGKRLVDNINQRWADEFDGMSHVVSNADFKGAELAPLPNRGETALTKDGLLMATMKSGKAAGKILRLWLIKVAMPILEKVSAGQLVSADDRKLLGAGAAAVFGVAPSESVPKLKAGTHTETREERLALQRRTRAADRLFKAGEITQTEWANILKASIGLITTVAKADTRQGVLALSAPKVRSKLDAMLMSSERFPLSAGGLGEFLGITDKMVGIIAIAIDMRPRSRVEVAPGPWGAGLVSASYVTANGRSRCVWRYSLKAAALIQAEAIKRKKVREEEAIGWLKHRLHAVPAANSDAERGDWAKGDDS